MHSILKINKGDRYGKLTVIKESHKNNHGARTVLCECDCGAIKEVSFWHLRSGHTKSCGCLSKEKIIKKCTTHGLSKSPLYKTYRNMITRCYNKNDKKYKNYGGRGIKVCDRWTNKENGFQNFLKDVGQKPSKKHTLERINNNGNYSPNNVIWVTYSMQNLNQRKRNDNKTGYTGICKCKNKWRSYITFEGTTKHLGYFNTIKKALETRNNFIKNNNLPHKIQKV